MTVTIGPATGAASRPAVVAVTTTDGAAITWDELFGEFAPALVSYARSRGVRAPEDLVQDVLVTAVEKLSEFQGDRRGLRSWLFSITYRRIADEHRRFYRSPELLVAEHSPIEDLDGEVDEAVVRGADAKEAFAALDVLRERERTVLEMRIIEEATPAEVGRRLGISAGNVRVIQARALVKVRKHLKSTRNAGLPDSIAYGVMPLVFFRYVGRDLPSDDVIGPWIEQIRIGAALGLGSGAGASGLAVAAEGAGAVAAAAASTSGTAGFIVGSAAKLGLVVSLAAAPVVVGGDDARPETVAALPVSSFVASTDSDGLGVPVADEPTPPTNSTVPSPPAPLATVPGSEVSPDHQDSADGGQGSASDAVQDPASSVPDGETDTSPADTSDNPVSSGGSSGSPDEGGNLLDTTTGVVEDVVEPVTDDIVEPLVNETLDIVDETLDAVEDDVVEPLVDDVVDPVVDETLNMVDETVDGVQDDVVEPLVDDVVVPLVDDLLGVGSGLLGG